MARPAAHGGREGKLIRAAHLWCDPKSRIWCAAHGGAQDEAERATCGCRECPEAGLFDWQGQSYAGCPYETISLPEWRALHHLAQVYAWQRRGFLPRGQGWLDEPAILVEAIELVGEVEVKLTEVKPDGR